MLRAQDRAPCTAAAVVRVGLGLGGCGCGQEKTMVSAQGLGGIIPEFAQGEGTMRPGLSLAEWQVGLCDSYSVFLSLQPSGAN